VRVGVRIAAGLRRLRPVAAALALALAASGCSSVGSPFEPTATAPPAATISFDTLDGPPPDVIHRLMRDLGEAAAAHDLAVVSKDNAATYRVRGYLAASGDADGATVAWVWDLYDRNQQRSFRIRGEETVAAGHRRWSAVDDTMSRQIARHSVEQFVSYLSKDADANGQNPATPPRERSWFLSGLDDFRPEASGIFRLFKGPISLTPPAIDDDETDVPLPRERPDAAPLVPDAFVALTEEP
jgi:hypothetical protein